MLRPLPLLLIAGLATPAIADDDVAPLRTTLDAELLGDLVWIERDWRGVVGVAPGSRGDALGVGFGGATSLENLVFIDGLDVTEPVFGVGGAYLPRWFIAQIDVRAGWVDAAHARSTGGRIAVTTRRGRDRPVSELHASWDPAALRGSPAHPEPAGFALERNSRSIGEVAVVHGGAVRRGRLWYLLGAAPTWSTTTTTRIVQTRIDRDQDGVPDGERELVEAKQVDAGTRVVPVMLRLDAAPASTHAASLTALITHTQADGDTSWPLGDPAAIRIDEARLDASVVGTWRAALDAATELEASVGWHRASSRRRSPDPERNRTPQDRSGDPFDWESDAVRRACQDDVADDPFPSITNCPELLGQFVLTGGIGYHADQVADRRSARIAGEHRVAGHRLDAGLDLSRRALDTTLYLSGGELTIDGTTERLVEIGEGPGFDETCAVLGAEPVSCRSVDRQVSRHASEIAALYVQDTWSPLRGLTVHGGLRHERQEIEDTVALSQPSPRLAATWELAGGRAYAAWGRFHEVIPLRLNQRFFADRAHQIAVDDVIVAPDAPEIADGLGSQYQDEQVAGIDLAVGPGLRVGASIEQRSLRRAIEDSGIDREALALTNPDTRRVYQGVTLTCATGPDRPLAVRASYSWARLRGNLAGLFQPHNGQVDPNLGSAFDDEWLAVNTGGPLPLDITHSLQIDGRYRRDLGDAGQLVLGLRGRVASGAPTSALGRHDIYGSREIFVLPRGVVGRAPAMASVDLRLVWRRELPGGVGAELFAEVFNLLDRRNVGAVDEVYTDDPVAPIAGGALEDLIFLKARGDSGLETSEPARRNSRHGEPITYAPPISARLGLAVTY